MKKTISSLAVAFLLLAIAPAAHAYPCTGGGCITTAAPECGGEQCLAARPTDECESEQC